MAFDLPLSSAEGANELHIIRTTKSVKEKQKDLGIGAPLELGDAISWGSNPVQYGVFVGSRAENNPQKDWLAFEYGESALGLSALHAWDWP